MDELLEWRADYSVGHETLDTQHRRLLNICKRVSNYQCDGTAHSIETFQSILSQLAFYADIHFNLEEELLRQAGFPDLQQQIEEHNAYRDWLIGFLPDAMRGVIDHLALQAYLGRWWLDHILLSDMAYRPHLTRHG